MSGRELHLFEGFGIELEYMIVDAETLDVLPVCDSVLKAVSGTFDSEVGRGPLGWSNELVLHVIELKTNGPAPALDHLPGLFAADVREINGILERFGGRLLPTAMHPWMDPERDTRLWPHEYSRVYESCNRIFGCRGHGWSNLQSTHINLPFAGDGEFGALHGAVRLVLPLLPAIAASSPAADGGLTGFMDTRLEQYRKNQRAVPSITGQIVPEPVRGRADYEDVILGPIYRDITPHDPDGILRHEWLNSRGAIARFDRSALEIRLLDIQECPSADLAVAAAVTALVRMLVNEYGDIAPPFSTERLAAVLLACIRDGEHAVIDDSGYLAILGLADMERPSAGAVWRRLYESRLSALMPQPFHAPFEHIFDEGTLARRIVRSLGKNPRMADFFRCYRRLADCLHANESFRA